MTNEEMMRQYMALDERVTRHTEQIKTCFNQIGEVKDLAEGVHKLATTVEIMVREQKDTNKKVDKLTSEVEAIKERPVRRLETGTTVAITVIVTAILTYVLTQLGLA